MTFEPVTNLQALPKTGIRVRVVSLGSTTGMLIKQIYLDARKVGIEGTYKGWVPGHGGDVWWIVHADQSVAAYMTTELEYWNSTECDCLLIECPLHEAAPLMLEVLRVVEWIPNINKNDTVLFLICISCGNRKVKGHLNHCTLNAAIKAARGE